MFRTNGRVGKSSKKEKAEVNYNKEFICPDCGVIQRVSKVEFGEVVSCMKCGASMEENL